jgi:carbon storage regulator
MLVLSRRVGQQIRMGKSVVVTLLRVERNKARIGVEAPPGIPVFRQELLDFDRSRPSAAATSAHVANGLPLRGDLRLRPIAARGFTPARDLWDNLAV